MSNEAAEKVLLTDEDDVFGGLMTPHNYEIIDCVAFCEVIFFASHPRICLGAFSIVSTGRVIGSRFFRRSAERGC
jgi:hypothetical protein